MSLEAWGDEGDLGPDGYVTEERADEMVKDATDELVAMLLEANDLCRSAFQIANRIATEFSTHELSTAFGPFADRLRESLERQLVVLNTHNAFASAKLTNHE